MEPLTNKWDKFCNYFNERTYMNHYVDAQGLFTSRIAPIGGAGNLKLIGTGVAATGLITVPKKAIGIRVALGGSKRTLLSTAIFYKLGIRGSLGRQVPTLFGPASSIETLLGRYTAPVGGGIVLYDFLTDDK
jgi:hypothetical protein